MAATVALHLLVATPSAAVRVGLAVAGLITVQAMQPAEVLVTAELEAAQ